MLKGRELISLPLITLNNRKQIGEIKDLIYNPLENKVAGYIVESGGWLRDSRVLLHSDIIRREDEGIFVADESVIKGIKSVNILKKMVEEKRDIRGLRVECEDGRYLGVIQDLVLDETTGEITGYEISDGVIQDLLNGRVTIPNAGISIGPDCIIASVNSRGLGV